MFEICVGLLSPKRDGFLSNAPYFDQKSECSVHRDPFSYKSGTFSPERLGAVWALTEDGSAAHGSFARQVGRMPTGKRAEAVRCGARDGIAWQTGKAPNGTWRADGRSGTPLSAGAFAHGCISASWKCSHARASPESRAGRPRPRADGSRRNVLGCGDAGP